ncbi:hypothetical protein CLOP_g573 [Closterium sp. NIES-67]|nr:hypothetical protein CLOP_g573 [Closterium sp. NIES-67]
MARSFPRAALALLLFVALAVLTPSALARTGLGISSKILASLRGTLNSCGGRGADVRSDTNGIADIRILRRGTSVYLAYKITAQGIAQPPSSPPAILTRNPCTIPSLSSTLGAAADVGAKAAASTGSDSAQASLGGSPSLNAVPAGFVSDVAGAVSGVGRAAGSVAGSAGKAAGSAAGLVGNVAGSAVGTAGKAAGSAGSLAGSAAGLVANAAGSAAGLVGNTAGSGVGTAGK